MADALHHIFNQGDGDSSALLLQQIKMTDLLRCWLDFKVDFIGVNEEPLNFDIFSFVFHIELKLWTGKELL